MAFAEIEEARIDKVVGGFCNRGVPLEVRDMLQPEYLVDRHDIEIFELQPRCNNLNATTHHNICTKQRKLQFEGKA